MLRMRVARKYILYQTLNKINDSRNKNTSHVRIKNIQNRKITFVNRKLNRYMNKIILAVVASKFTNSC